MKMFVAKVALPSVLALMLGAGACQKGSKDLVITIKQGEGEPLAQVGNITLTVEELKQKFLQRQGSFQGAAHLNTDKKRSEFVENAVTQKALFLAAIEKGITNDPEVIEAYEKAAVQKMLRQMISEAQTNYTPTEEEMKEYYDKNPTYFKHGEAYKVAYLAVPVGNDKKKAKEIAQKLQIEATKNVKNSDTREFARLAMKFAQDSKNKMPGHFSIEANESPYLEKAAFEEKFGKDSFDTVKGVGILGSVGPILSTDTSFIVFMKTGERTELDENFADAKPKIVKRLSFEKRGKIYEDLISSLKEKFKVKIYEEKIAKLSEGAGTAPSATAQANQASPPQAAAPGAAGAPQGQAPEPAKAAPEAAKPNPSAPANPSATPAPAA